MTNRRQTIDISDLWTTHDSRVAIQLAHGHVTAILGHAHCGDTRDDRELTAALCAAGAPWWVIGAHGWLDEYGWGIEGPTIEAALTDADCASAAGGRRLTDDLAGVLHASECYLLAEGVAVAPESTGPVRFLEDGDIVAALLALGYIGGQR